MSQGQYGSQCIPDYLRYSAIVLSTRNAPEMICQQSSAQTRWESSQCSPRRSNWIWGGDPQDREGTLAHKGNGSEKEEERKGEGMVGYTGSSFSLPDLRCLQSIINSLYWLVIQLSSDMFAKKWTQHISLCAMARWNRSDILASLNFSPLWMTRHRIPSHAACSCNVCLMFISTESKHWTWSAPWFGKPFTTSGQEMEQALFLQPCSPHWTFISRSVHARLQCLCAAVTIYVTVVDLQIFFYILTPYDLEMYVKLEVLICQLMHPTQMHLCKSVNCGDNAHVRFFFDGLNTQWSRSGWPIFVTICATLVNTDSILTSLYEQLS